MLVLSLFPGIGLLDHAFELEGYCTVRGPDVIWGGDIRAFHPPAGKFDGVIGGPPCQMFSSLAHLVRANGLEPRFGNLIPEFERCVSEAQPEWFLMENVRAAPVPVVPGYGTKDFLLDNAHLDSGDGHGQEQTRLRRFTFGLRGRRCCTCGYCKECYEAIRTDTFERRRNMLIPPTDVPDLRRWIDLAVFFLPDAVTAQTAGGCGSGAGRPDCRAPRKVMQPPVNAGHHDGTDMPHNKVNHARTRRNAVLAASSQNEGCLGETAAKKARKKSVSASNGGCGAGEYGRHTEGAGNNGKGRYRLADACRLQGLPEDFLKDCPFTAEGKLKAVANGVPIPMGRAIARAVKEAIALASALPQD